MTNSPTQYVAILDDGRMFGLLAHAYGMRMDEHRRLEASPWEASNPDGVFAKACALADREGQGCRVVQVCWAAPRDVPGRERHVLSTGYVIEARDAYTVPPSYWTRLERRIHALPAGVRAVRRANRSRGAVEGPALVLQVKGCTYTLPPIANPPREKRLHPKAVRERIAKLQKKKKWDTKPKRPTMPKLRPMTAAQVEKFHRELAEVNAELAYQRAARDKVAAMREREAVAS